MKASTFCLWDTLCYTRRQRLEQVFTCLDAIRAVAAASVAMQMVAFMARKAEDTGFICAQAQRSNTACVATDYRWLRPGCREKSIGDLGMAAPACFPLGTPVSPPSCPIWSIYGDGEWRRSPGQSTPDVISWIAKAP
jgi:hypothetical protein